LPPLIRADVEKEKILFIINPISGAKNKIRIPDLVKDNLDSSQFDFDVIHTKAGGHAEELTAEGLNSGYKKFIAVGGDGTINEIARVLINKDGQLGIIPSGSGNGLSRHLGIPLNPVDAIKAINNNTVIKIDAGTINGRPFFCTAGVGFDAHIGKVFAQSKIRGLNTYVRTTISEFVNYTPQHYSINIDGEKLEKKAFLITFANSAQYGNNAYISPHADIQDGLLDLCVLAPFPKYQMIELGVRVFRKTADKSKYLEIIKGKEITVEREFEGPIHCDGEPFEAGQILTVKVIPSSLNVIVP